MHTTYLIDQKIIPCLMDIVEKNFDEKMGMTCMLILKDIAQSGFANLHLSD